MSSQNTHTNRSTKEQETSYTSMSVGDVDAIGAHCQNAFCHQLDFLPFRCESCHGTFCLDHRTETAHNCANAGAWARARREAEISKDYRPTARPSLLDHEQQCSSPSCKTLIHTGLVPGVHCNTCRRDYCLKHRMPEEHDCSNLKPLGVASSTALAAQKEKGMAALEKLRAWGASKKAGASSAGSTSKTPTFRTPSFFSKASSKVSSSSSAAARAAEVNKLKQSAKGEASIPAESRVYLHVEASADTTTAKFPTGNFFYNKDWTVGRVLDAAAKALQVQNVNNRGGGEETRLRVFHVEGGRLLDFSEKLGASVQTGNTIVLLRGVGPPVPDLLQT